MLDPGAIAAHSDRALSPEHPVVRGTSQNPDAFFQGREAANAFHDACPDVVADTMARFAELTGRSYAPFNYVGHPQAERVVVMMGSGAQCAHETVEHLVAAGEKVGLVKVRLYRPFSRERFGKAVKREGTVQSAHHEPHLFSGGTQALCGLMSTLRSGANQHLKQLRLRTGDGVERRLGGAS